MPIDPNMDYDLDFDRNMEQIDVSQRRLENRLGAGTQPKRLKSFTKGRWNKNLAGTALANRANPP